MADRLPPAGRAQCGSPAGYSMHVSHHEKPCDACRVAHNADTRKPPRAAGRRLLELSRQLGAAVEEHATLADDAERDLFEATRRVLRRMAGELAEGELK